MRTITGCKSGITTRDSGTILQNCAKVSSGLQNYTKVPELFSECIARCPPPSSDGSVELDGKNASTCIGGRRPYGEGEFPSVEPWHGGPHVNVWCLGDDARSMHLLLFFEGHSWIDWAVRVEDAYVVVTQVTERWDGWWWYEWSPLLTLLSIEIRWMRVTFQTVV